MHTDSDDGGAHLISVHFPKASGSSLLAAFQRAVGIDNVLMDYADDPANPENLTRRRFCPFSGEPPELRRIVHGHFPIEKYRWVANAYRVTLLRHPVDNLISIYFFWKVIAVGDLLGHSIFNAFKFEQPTLLNFAMHPVMRRLMSDTYFGGCDMQEFVAIGDFSKRQDYHRALSALMRVEFDDSIRENSPGISDERATVMADQRVVAKLERILSDDIAFFERWAGRYSIDILQATTGI